MAERNTRSIPNQNPDARAVNRSTGEVLSPADVDSEILRIGGLLEEATGEYAVLARTAAVAEVDYRREYARSHLKAMASPGSGRSGQTTVGEAEARATLEVADLLMERKIAEAVAEAQKQLMSTYRTQIDYLRTIAANLREQV